jgi:hydrogenase/urease accessory protein HupE
MLPVRRTVRSAFIALLAVCGTAAICGAHPAPFSFLDVTLDGGRVGGTLTVHDLDAARVLGIADGARLHDAATARAHGPALAAILQRRLRLTVDGRPAVVELSELTPLPDRQAVRFLIAATGPGGTAGQVSVDAALFPDDPMHQTFVNVYEGGALRHQAILDARRTAMTYYAGSWPGVAAVLATFVPAGVHHIAIGPDHLLFLVGLLLLGGSAARLAGIVTAFTLGHSVTLTLAAAGVVTLPGRVVEPAIALTLVLVGVDNLLAGTSPAARRDLRPGMAALFGLIHGFGFAAVLREIGLPQGALGWSLFGFNLGVELGQLALVLPLALVLAWLRRQRPEAARRIAVMGSVVVALAGAWWFVQRLFFSGSVA